MLTRLAFAVALVVVAAPPALVARELPGAGMAGDTLPTVAVTDTTIAVRAGTRLELSNHAGNVVVQTWDRSAVRVVARPSPGMRVRIETIGSILRIQSEHGGRGKQGVDYTLTVPAAMPLSLNGVEGSIIVRGARGPIEASTVQGIVEVEGGQDKIDLSSVQGAIVLSGARGQVDVQTVNGSVHVSETSGDISAVTVNGVVHLTGITSSAIRAESVNGQLSYDGTIAGDGHYSFATHNGNITLTVPRDASATVTAVTYGGTVHSSFPVALTETRRGRRFSFVLGAGEARIELESFQGEIGIRRPGETLENRRKKP